MAGTFGGLSAGHEDLVSFIETCVAKTHYKTQNTATLLRSWSGSLVQRQSKALTPDPCQHAGMSELYTACGAIALIVGRP